MAWLIIGVAGLFETGFAVSLKLSHGMTRLWPTVSFAACALVSFALLTVALRRLEVGPAYAVWTGIGAAGAAIWGMIFLGDAVSTPALPAVATLSAMIAVSLGSTGKIASRAGTRTAIAYAITEPTCRLNSAFTGAPPFPAAASHAAG
jgi:quaternary ammonium compound-resistance protein SugE